jgi:hypothetical protein
MGKDERVRLGQRLHRVLKDPDFQKVILEIRKDYGKRILDTHSEEGRNDLYYEARALDRVVGQMNDFATDFVNSGKQNA